MYDAFTTPNTREEARLTAGWIEACRERSSLYSDLNRLIPGRLDEIQAEFRRATKVAGDKCYSSLAALRAHRNATLNSNWAKQQEI